MMCGPLTTHWLSAVGFVAYGSVLLAPLSPLSMWATPTVFGFGGSFLFIQASPQACHSLSRHIESPARSSMHIHPLVPARSSFILPSAPMPMTAALRPMSGGAALVAFAMAAASDLAPPALTMPSWPDVGGSFILSCATAVTAASM